MNHIMIAGHLGADPEVRFTSTGKKVTTLRVATNVRKGNVEETVWWRVTLWGDQFDKMVAFLKKGSAVIVFGEMQKPELFADREGKQQISLNLTAHQIQFSPFGKPERSHQESGHHESGPVSHAAPASSYSARESYAPQPAAAAAPSKPSMQVSGETFDDEIPF